MPTMSPKILATLTTFADDSRVVIGILPEGKWTDEPRVLFISPSGSQRKTLPCPVGLYEQFVTPTPPSKPKGKGKRVPSCKVVVEQSAKAAPAPERELPVLISLRDGEHHWAFYARAIKNGYTRKESVKLFTKLNKARKAQSKTASVDEAQPGITDNPVIPVDANGIDDLDSLIQDRKQAKRMQADRQRKAASLSHKVAQNSEALGTLANNQVRMTELLLAIDERLA